MIRAAGHRARATSGDVGGAQTTHNPDIQGWPRPRYDDTGNTQGREAEPEWVRFSVKLANGEVTVSSDS
jgi:hypothetical protein